MFVPTWLMIPGVALSLWFAYLAGRSTVEADAARAEAKRLARDLASWRRAEESFVAAVAERRPWGVGDPVPSDLDDLSPGQRHLVRMAIEAREAMKQSQDA